MFSRAFICFDGAIDFVEEGYEMNHILSLFFLMLNFVRI